MAWHGRTKRREFECVVKKKNPRTLPGAARSDMELGASILAVGDLRGPLFARPAVLALSGYRVTRSKSVSMPMTELRLSCQLWPSCRPPRTPEVLCDAEGGAPLKGRLDSAVLPQPQPIFAPTTPLSVHFRATTDKSGFWPRTAQPEFMFGARNQPRRPN